jgi:hypothetical protein
MGISGNEALLRLLFKEFVQSSLRVLCDFQSLFVRSSFTLSVRWFSFLRHFVLISQEIPGGENLVPQPGFGPGRPEWPHGCKPCAYTSSATGARKSQDVGTQGTFAGFGVPTFFGLSSATLGPSSKCSPLPTSTRLNRGSQHANHSFQDLALRFCEIRWVLDKAVRHSR